MRGIRERWLIGLAGALLISLSGCGQSEIDSSEMEAKAAQLRESKPFRFPLDDYFPEIPVTADLPPPGELYHAAEDCFAPPGTPVYAIGDGIISYSGRMRGYGWLIIIDHPAENVYSLYGHLSTSRWKLESGHVKQGEHIGFIGDAEECYTMLPHIHFGLRIGQRTDYPPLGNRRWMAGYTDCRPDLVGWFHPSDIIGETKSMREWKHYIRKREIITGEESRQASDFRITSTKHHEKEDLDQVIRDEFGDGYRLADWKDILAFSNNIEAWADAVGLPEGEGNSLLISYEGYRIWLGRQYFISRFDQQRPPHYLAHDEIHDGHFCLGSWQGLNNRALAVRK